MHPYSGCIMFSGFVQRLWRHCSGNAETRLPNTRRHTQYPWLSLIGLIATGGNRNAQAEAEFHDIFYIGPQATLKVERSGYLFCYANDCWEGYKRNHGSLELVVKRVE